MKNEEKTAKVKNETVRQGIKAIIKEKGTTQKQLAEGYGCSQSTISRVIGVEDKQIYLAEQLGFKSWKELCKAGLKKEKENKKNGN